MKKPNWQNVLDGTFKFGNRWVYRAAITNNSFGNGNFQVKGSLPVELRNNDNFEITKIHTNINSVIDMQKLSDIIEITSIVPIKCKKGKYYVVDSLIERALFEKEYVDVALYYHPESKMFLRQSYNYYWWGANKHQTYYPLFFYHGKSLVGLIMPIEANIIRFMNDNKCEILH